ncbi:hypothetical protein ACTA71_004820 [Dictyostelium dimigraforme]
MSFKVLELHPSNLHVKYFNNFTQAEIIGKVLDIPNTTILKMKLIATKISVSTIPSMNVLYNNLYSLITNPTIISIERIGSSPLIDANFNCPHFEPKKGISINH